MKKAEVTRLNILQKAFELIYSHGYQTTSIDHILATTQVTKGAFYYHFKNKDEMGIAILNELLRPVLANSFTESFNKDSNPTETIYCLMHHLLMEDDFLKLQYGCPVSNFIQEMTPWNDSFSTELNEITQGWIHIISNLIINGKKNGFIRETVNEEQVSQFIISGYWGIRNLGKLTKDKGVYLSYLEELKNYLSNLNN